MIRLTEESPVTTEPEILDIDFIPLKQSAFQQAPFES
jgi:hypothetical protein